MQNKILSVFFSVFMLAGLLLTGCSEDDPFVLRSTDMMDFKYASSAQTFTVCTDGSWSVEGVDDEGNPVDWIELEPASGKGDGVTREIVTVKVKRNSGEERKGIVKLYAANRDLNIAITQEEGTLIMGSPYLSGMLPKGKDLEEVYLVIPYSRGTIGDNFQIDTQVSGDAAEGIVVAPYAVSLAEEKGNIQIPVTGHPLKEGAVAFDLSTTHPAYPALAVVNGKVEISTNEDPLGTVYYREAFDKMIWGGDYIAQTVGVKPKKFSNDIDPFAEAEECTIGTDGSNSLVGSMSANYVEARGFTGWTGNRIYERPGYIKIGVTATAGWAITPPLTGLVGKTNVKVTFKAANWEGASTSIVVSAENTGSVRQGVVEGLKFTDWQQFTVEIDGVTEQTCIKFGSPDGVTNGRFFIDDIVIEKIN
ncbi:MAG: BACON domain-containing protein [Bacteroidales bacterium]